MAIAIRRFAPVVLAASLFVPVSAGSASTSAMCIPSVSGSGPTVYVQPDYAHPGQSQVYYDSSAISVQTNTCL